jgi:hypothetical protein
MMGAMAITGGAVNRSDPILAAIYRHRITDAALEAAINVGRDPEIEIAMNAEDRAFWSLVEVRPTTATGVWALCDHLAEYATHEDQISERLDYNSARGWRFMTRLLENIRDALEEITDGNGLPMKQKVQIATTPLLRL